MKGQSMVMQFVLFFLIGFTIFLAVGNLFRTQSDIFREDVASLSAKLANTYLSSVVITTTSTCKQCDYVDIAVKIPETYAGQYLESSLSSAGLNVSAQNKYSSSSLHNLNSTLDLGGKSASASSSYVQIIQTTGGFYDSEGNLIGNPINITFLSAGSNTTLNIKIPKNASVSLGRLNVTVANSDGVGKTTMDIGNDGDTDWSYAWEEEFRIIVNSRTNKNCNTICGEAGRTCSGAGTNDGADDNTYYEGTQPSRGYYFFCKQSPLGIHTCTQSMASQNSAVCPYGTYRSFWTRCKCYMSPKIFPETITFTSELQSLLPSCQPFDTENNCLIPLNITTDLPANITLDKLKIDYSTSYKKIDKPITLTYNKNKNKIEVS